MPSLFDPIRIGTLELPNRIIMAPLTRARALGAGRVPNALMAEYYAQRASAGLIISEATSVSPQGVGYANTPGLWSTAQVAGWVQVTQAVHAVGGRIFAQLWHVGRISDPSLLDGEWPVAPSALAAGGHVSLLRPERPFVIPRALALEELPGLVETYRQAAENAQRAGFDGVEVHGANGYLLDQFLQDSSNLRQDSYGGALENRARLLLEVTDACISVWGAARVGVHLAPRGGSYDMANSNPEATFTYVARQLGQRGIAFLFSRDGQVNAPLATALREAFAGPYIANEGLTQASAEQMLRQGGADAAAFGHLFLANPDLPLRFQSGAALNRQRPESFIAAGAEGYTDYPTA